MTKVGLIRILAVAMILAGLVLGGGAVYNFIHKQQVDSDQEKAWQQFVVAASGAVPAGSPDSLPATASPTAGPTGLPNGIYLKMTLPSVGKDAVAVNGDWSSLKVFNTVHYRSSPAPGQQGNMLIAFHREPKWLDIDHVKAGDTVQVDTIDGRSYHYQVDFVRVVSATDITYLKPTDGHDLTLVTCDPPYRDNNRMVFRAHLVTG